jgi:hypothetical protein
VRVRESLRHEIFVLKTKRPNQYSVGPCYFMCVGIAQIA